MTLVSALSTLRSIPSNPMNSIFLNRFINLLVLASLLLQSHLQAKAHETLTVKINAEKALRISASSASMGTNFSPHPSHQSSVKFPVWQIQSLDTSVHFHNYWDGLLLGLEKAVLRDFLAFRGHSSEGQRSPACRQAPTERVSYIFT